MINSIKNSTGSQYKKSVIIPYTSDSIYKIIANTIYVEDRDTKIIFILNKVFNLKTQCLEKIFKMSAAQIEHKLGSLDQADDSALLKDSTKNNKHIENETDIYADMFSDMFNNIFYSPDFGSYFKKSFFLNTVNLFLSIIKLKLHNNPKLFAFISYTCLITSKLAAAFDQYNRPVTLREQDRSTWDRKLINKGINYLDKSARGDHISIHHLEAAVAACHCLANRYENTDWNKILSLYDQYLQFNKSAYVELKRAVVISKLKNPVLGLQIAEGIKNSKDIDGQPILYSTIASFHLQLHNYEQALINYKTAYKLSDVNIDRSFLSRKINICNERIRMINRYDLNNSF